MKITILTLGSRGDVQPFVALGIGLKQAGHEVAICTSCSFADFIRDHGLNYAYMNNFIVELIDSDVGRQAIESASNPLAWFRTAIKLTKQLRPAQRQMLEEEWAACQGAEIIIYHPKALGGYHIAEKLGIPSFVGLPFPNHVPTQAFPHIIFPELSLGGWYNKLTYRVVSLLSSSYRGFVNSWRKEVLDLPPTSSPLNSLVSPTGQLLPVLNAYSPHVLPKPDDWPETAVTTGYWFLEEQANWQPPTALVDFLAAGIPPVYIGFGSISGRKPQKTTQIILAALAKAGQRGILAKGWGGLEIEDLPDYVFPLETVPHSWLFPQVAAVVHHGGAGTTAAGLRAGKPTIICPFFGDQPFWGRRVAKLGVGPEPLPQKQLNADNLSAAIHQAVTDSSMCDRAAKLGEKICAEDGVGKAIAFIEENCAVPYSPYH